MNKRKVGDREGVAFVAVYKFTLFQRRHLANASKYYGSKTIAAFRKEVSLVIKRMERNFLQEFVHINLRC